ncbi:hypothetical protein HQ560_19880 [bacterium]|nr:hypothetical protein [bacterium]
MSARNPHAFDTRRFGAVPFWFWNGDQSEAEITRQLELARAGGLRGMAVHARAGNRTEYMSERWLALVRHACSEARRLGLEIWLYDEEGYPSGSVGGRLPARGEQYQQHALAYAYVTAAEAAQDPHLVRAFAADDLAVPVAPASLPPDTEVLAFSKTCLPHYVDTLDRDVLEAFLDMTHRPYAEALSEFFGNTVTAVYTDDLNHLLVHGGHDPYLSYTDALEDVFRQRFGYSLLDRLPALVENVPDNGRVRIDYRRTVLRLFLDNFVEPMRQWCDRHGVLLTGHLSGDEGTMLQAICRFTAPMPFYEHETVPGIDDFLVGMHDSGYLRRCFNRLGFSGVLLCKQATSVANQLKEGRCGSEVLTSLGWGVPVRQQMAQLHFQHGLGVNLITHHDFSYATEGLTKRDHPASYFFQQPWYAENPALHDAMARTSQLVARGRCAARVLVLHPVTSGWLAVDGAAMDGAFVCRHPGALPGTESVEADFAALSLGLLQRRVDFEYGDEELLARHGDVRNGTLTVGAGAYDTVILPPMSNILSTTLDLLQRFDAEGGASLITGDGPRLLDGGPWDGAIPGRRVQDLADEDLPTHLDVVCSPSDGPDETLLHTRRVGGHLEYFLINFADAARTLTLGARLDGYSLYDPQTDRIVEHDGGVPPAFALHPLACCHLLPGETVASPRVALADTLFAPDLLDSLRPLPTQPHVTVEAENENALILDAGLLDDGSRVLFHGSATSVPAGARVMIPIDVPDPTVVTRLYAENPDRLALAVNGEALRLDALEPHPATQDLLGIRLDGLLRPGRNGIALTSPGDRLETMVLTGRFGVRLVESADGCRAELAETSLGLGDLTEQGLPFYWGAVRARFAFQLDAAPARCWLDLGETDGVVRIFVNGQDVGLRYGAPWLFNISDAVRDGANRVEAVLRNTAQNFFGPHRAAEGGSGAAWIPEPRGSCADSWRAASFGIFGPIRVWVGGPMETAVRE